MNNRIRCCIFDWAGTTVDYGCFAPLEVFVRVFEKRGITITEQEARAPMGMAKREHIRELCRIPRIASQWNDRFGADPADSDVESLYADFEPMLFECLSGYSRPIDGVIETVSLLKQKGVKIGSTTGYTRAMMEIVAPEAARLGYSPDSLVTPDDVSEGRPAPWMIYRNCERLNIWPLSSVVKIGDTVADIKEGVNASVWSVGVIVGSSEMGLTKDAYDALCDAEKQQNRQRVRRVFSDAGASFVIDTIAELPDLIETIEEQMKGVFNG